MPDSSKTSDVEKSATLAIQSLLVWKSKKNYENDVNLTTDVSKKEYDMINEEVLLAYFEQKIKVYKSSTL